MENGASGCQGPGNEWILVIACILAICVNILVVVTTL